MDWRQSFTNRGLISLTILFRVVVLTHDELCTTFSKFDLKRLELYSRNMAEHYMITDLLPSS